MKRNILIILVFVLLIAGATAGGLIAKNIAVTLADKDADILTAKGITNLKVSETVCNDNQCKFMISGNNISKEIYFSYNKCTEIDDVVSCVKLSDAEVQAERDKLVKETLQVIATASAKRGTTEIEKVGAGDILVSKGGKI